MGGGTERTLWWLPCSHSTTSCCPTLSWRRSERFCRGSRCLCCIYVYKCIFTYGDCNLWPSGGGRGESDCRGDQCKGTSSKGQRCTFSSGLKPWSSHVQGSITTRSFAEGLTWLVLIGQVQIVQSGLDWHVLVRMLNVRQLYAVVLPALDHGACDSMFYCYSSFSSVSKLCIAVKLDFWVIQYSTVPYYCPLMFKNNLKFGVPSLWNRCIWKITVDLWFRSNTKAGSKKFTL